MLSFPLLVLMAMALPDLRKDSPKSLAQKQTSLVQLGKSMRWHMQRRRLYVKWAADRVDEKLDYAWRAVVPMRPQTVLARAMPEHAVRGVHSYHAASPADFVLPPDVIACSYMPDPGVRAHTVRLLKDRWTSDAMPLAPIPEHEDNRKTGLARLAAQVAMGVWD